MIKIKPIGPWANPKLTPGVYEVTVVSLSERIYDVDSVKLEIMLYLATEDCYLMTCIYFPKGFSINSQKRLWHFCRALKIEQCGFTDNPQCVVGRSLTIKVQTNYPSNSDRKPYSDVAQFLLSSNSENCVHVTAEVDDDTPSTIARG